MENLPLNSHFYKTFKNLLKGKLTAREVLVYGIIYSFKDNPNGCWISRADIAKRINESEATAERAVQLLISEGYIRTHRKGRLRYYTLTDLYQVDTNEPDDLYQNKGPSVSKQGSDLYQVDTLLRSITKIPTKIQNKNSIGSESDPDKDNLIKSNPIAGSASNEIEGEPMSKETEKEKELRLRLNALRNDPVGWEDHGTYLTKFDPETRTTLRKAKPVHPEKTWNGKGDWKDLPE